MIATKTPNVICENCKNPFFKKKGERTRTKLNFCSRSCSCTFHNKERSEFGLHTNPPKERKCKFCGETYFNKTNKHAARSTCPKCLHRSSYNKAELMKMTLGEYTNRLSTKEKHPSWKFSGIRLLNRKWNRHLLAKPCANCGYSKHVELCHIRGLATLSEQTTIGEANSINNNIQLCRNCHWELDHNLITIDRISAM